MKKAGALLTDADIIALAPLRRGGQTGYWRPSPRSKNLRVYRHAVYRLVGAGLLAWGNRSHSFVVRVS